MPRDWSRSKYKSVLSQMKRELREAQAFEAVRFVDFTCEPHSFMSQLYAIANAHGLKVSCVSTATRVIYRFWNPRSPWKPNLMMFPVVKRAKREEES